MEVFVHRDPTGYQTFDMEGIDELEEHLKSVETFEPLDDNEEVHLDITGRWSEIRELLSQDCFKEIWFDPRTSPSAVRYFCDVCGIGEWSTSEKLPDGWITKKDEADRLILCPVCKEGKND